MVELAQEEPSYTLTAEIYKIAREWWLEYDPEDPLEPNIAMYVDLMEANLARCFTCRKDGKLIGFAIFAFTRSNHSGKRQAMLDTLVVAREHRGSDSIKFIKYCVDVLQSENREILMCVTDKRDYSNILKRMGFVKDSTMYVMR
jgi:predicted GNAT family N-acyltransferase